MHLPVTLLGTSVQSAVAATYCMAQVLDELV